MASIKNCNAIVDVVIPAFNAERYIQETLESVVSQGNFVRAIFIVNDGSTDKTMQVVHAFANAHSNLEFILINQPNKGLANARNTGITQTTAPFVALLDADDVWLKDKLRMQLDVFSVNPDPKLGVVYGSYELIDENSQRIIGDHKVIQPRVRGNVSNSLNAGNFISGSGSNVLIKSEVFKRVGTFDEELRASEDWDMWLRISEHFHFDFVDRPLVQIRVHPDNMQKDFSRMLASELAMLNKFAQHGKHNYFLLSKIQTILFKKKMPAQEISGFETSEPWVKAQLTGAQSFLWRLLLCAPNAIWTPLKKVKRFLTN